MHRYLLLTLLTLASISAKAEYCWMVGCQGSVAYVYMPVSQINSGLASGDGVIRINAKAYHLDSSNRLLNRTGLPDVGETVTLNIFSYLLSYDEIRQSAVQSEIRKNWFLLDNQRGEVSIYAYDFSTLGGKMRPNVRLKIMGYIGSAVSGTSNLFALVQVQND